MASKKITGYNNAMFAVTLLGIPDWQQLGYTIKLVFLYLPDVEIAIERVRYRVQQGGHNVPEKIIRRRYEKGWYNFLNIYKQLVDAWVLFDNSGRLPRLINEGEKA